MNYMILQRYCVREFAATGADTKDYQQCFKLAGAAIKNSRDNI